MGARGALTCAVRGLKALAEVGKKEDNQKRVVFHYRHPVFLGKVLVLTLAALCGVGAAQSPTHPSTPSSTQSSVRKSTATKKKSARTVAARKRRKPPSPRVRRMHEAFVASASLKPMARQLLQDRTPAAYAGVEAYARRHAKEDAGALAWLVIGYAHTLDKDYVHAIDPLNRAKPRAGDLGDYVNFYLGTAYYQTGRLAEAVATLERFR